MKTAREVAQTKRALRDAGVTYGQVAKVAGVSWRMVAYVVHGEKASANVEGWIERLCRVSQ
jgi:hypothetical protein